ncbi:MAG: ATP-binding protein [Nitrospirota bacterium]
MNNRHKKPSGIPWHLIIFFLVLSTGIGAIGYYYYRGQLENAMKEKMKELSAIADLKVEQIEHWREERMIDASYIYNNPVIADQIMHLQKNPSSSVHRRDILGWMKPVQENRHYEQMYLFDREMNVLIALPEQHGEFCPEMKMHLEQAMHTKRVLMTDLFRNRALHIYMDIVIPLIAPAGEDTPIAGFVVLRINPNDFLYPLILSWPVPSTTAESLLIRHEGGEVIFLNELRHRKNTAFIMRFPVTKKDLPAAMASRGIKGEVEGIDYRGVPVLAAIRNIHDSPWHLIAKVDKSEVLSLHHLQFRLIASLSGILIIALGLIAGMLWRHQQAQFYRRHEERFRQLFENMSSGVAVYETTDNGENFLFVDMNHAAERITHVSRTDIVGENVTDAFPGIREMGLLEVFQRVWRSGTPETYPATRYTDEKLSFWVHNYVYKLPSGELVAIFDDITERKQAEEALHYQEALLKETGRIAKVGGWEFDTASLRGTWTDEVAHIHDFDPDDETNVEIGLSYYQGESRTRIETAVKEAIEMGKPYDLELEMTTPKGNHKWVRTIGHPIVEDGKVVKVRGSFQDITEQKHAEKELRIYRDHLETLVQERTAELEQANVRLRELDRLKSMFIASMSHELRTPLNSIIGFTGIILQGMVGPLNEEQQKQLTMVKNSARHLLDLINDIIDLSKIEAGKVQLFVEEFDLSILMQEVFSSFRNSAEKKGLGFSLHMPDSVVVVSDRKRIQQVMLNLVGNAIKFTDKGSVKIVARYGEQGTDRKGREPSDDGFIEITVEDTGIGIRQEDMNKLFTAFGMVRVEGMPVQEGTGLGLYLSKKLAALLGGTITAASEFGKGSRFSFTLPVRRGYA